MTVATRQDLLYPGKAMDFFARGVFPPFNPAITDYNRVNVRWLAELSRLEYKRDVAEQTLPPEPTRASFFEQVGFR